MLDRFLPESGAARLLIGVAATALAVVITTQLVLPGQGTGGRGTPAAILFSGLVDGVLLSISAVGLVVVYRALRIINFAQGVLGVVGGALLGLLLALTNVPFLVAFPICVLLGGVVGAILGVFTLRFSRGSRLFLTVVTIVAIPAIFTTIQYLINLPIFPDATERSSDQLIQTPEDIQRLLPLPGLNFTVGSLEIRFRFIHLFALEVGLLAIAAVWAFFRYTKTGTAIRAISENPERASLLGVGVGAISVVVWTISGLLSGVSAGLGFGLVGQAQSGSANQQALLLLPLLTAAVIGRFTKLGVTVVAAIALGVLQAAYNYSYVQRAALFYVFLFVGVLVALVLQRGRRGRSETADVSWSATEEPRPVPKELGTITGVRLARYGLVAVMLAAAALFPFLATINRIQLLSVVFITAIAVLSLVVLTGWAGQVSLGQWGFVAVGSVVGGALTAKVGLSFWLAIPVTVALTAALAVVVGLPALRVRGLFLMVATFGFAAAVEVFLFDKKYFSWLLPQEVERPTLFFFDFQDEKSMYFLSLAALVVAIVIVRNLRRSRVGRILIALRENEANVQAFGVSVVRAKLMAFAIAGALCGFAGIVFAHQQQGVSAGSFTAFASFNVFTQAVVGGVSSPAGALLGAAYFTLTSQFLGNNAILSTIFSGFAPLLIIFVAPGGFISLFNAVRDSVLRIVAQRRQIVVPSLFADYDPEVLENRLIPLAEPDGVSGLAALPIEQRFALSSGLYQGTGERIIDKLGPAREAHEKVAIGAAARNASEIEVEALIATEDS